jgi:hypothetical protein
LVEPLAAVFDHGWLAAVLPAEARRFRVSDSRLGALLVDAGGELVERDPEVEIAPASQVEGDASLAVVSFGAPPHDSTLLAVRVARRLANAARVRVKALGARRVVRRRGYRQVDVVLWDVRQRFRLPGAGAGRRRSAEYLPQRALVIGRRSPMGRSLLDASLEAAGRAVGAPLQGETPTVRAGLVATMTNGGLLRVAVGPARRQVEEQLKALEALRAGGAGLAVSDRVPWPLADGRSGLADWSLERRLPGARPERLGDELLGQCVEFLAVLHAAGGTELVRSLSACAEEVAAFRPPPEAEALRELGARLDSALGEVPLGFGHGDFFLGNLLVEGERLTGVIDWDAGGPGRLPLLDLIHLLHLAQYPLADEDWGPALVRHLLPWARSGGDDVTRDYCTRIGLSLDLRRLEAFALAYWLDRLAYQLRTHRQRRTEPRWLARNVDVVLHAAGAET